MAVAVTLAAAAVTPAAVAAAVAVGGRVAAAAAAARPAVSADRSGAGADAVESPTASSCCLRAAGQKCRGHRSELAGLEHLGRSSGEKVCCVGIITDMGSPA